MANLKNGAIMCLKKKKRSGHKLGRKIAREEHWITHGVSGRRKRNVRRLRELGDLKTRKRSEKKIASGVNITVAEAGIIRQTGSATAQYFQKLWRQKDC